MNAKRLLKLAHSLEEVPFRWFSITNILFVMPECKGSIAAYFDLDINDYELLFGENSYYNQPVTPKKVAAAIRGFVASRTALPATGNNPILDGINALGFPGDRRRHASGDKE